jgi:hypothetical protein
MMFQRVLKGINGLSEKDVEAVLANGLRCNWLRKKRHLSIQRVEERLTEATLYNHIAAYKQPDPDPEFAGYLFHEHSPFISTTAGTLQARKRSYHPFPARPTAIRFATDTFKSPGYVFFAYVLILGRRSIPLVEFAEEVRDVHQYPKHFLWQEQGEIAAKIIIQPSRIERAEHYDPASSRTRPTKVIPNSRYRRPEDFVNLREAL